MPESRSDFSERKGMGLRAELERQTISRLAGEITGALIFALGFFLFF